jgi:hypothetical protein
MREGRMKAGLVAGSLALMPALALAEGCALSGGVVLSKVEALNQLMLDLDLARFAARVEAELGGQITGEMTEVAEIYAEGFDGCVTFAQRVDQGGMVQNLVMFEGKTAPLYLYWLAVKEGEREVLMSLQFSTDLDDVMAKLR